MLEEFFERLATDKRSRGNPLVVHLSPFAASLKEDGYTVATMQSKLSLLVDFGQWLGRSGLAVTELCERTAEKFFAESGEEAESVEAIGKRSGSFLIIFENVTLSQA